MIRYSLVQLETYYWVARLGGFHAAARQLRVSQPTVTLRVRGLERAIGTELFDRTGYRPKPTQRGAAIYRHAEQVLELADTIQTVGHEPDLMHGLLRIGAADMFAVSYLPLLLTVLERQYPNLQVELVVDFSSNLSRKLADGELDVAMLTNESSSAAIDTEPLDPVELSWVASPELELPGRPLGPDDLAGFRVITNPPPSHLYRTVTGWFAGARNKPETISTCNTLHIMARLVMAGFGVSILPVALHGADFETGRMRRLATVPKVEAHLSNIAWRTDGYGPGIEAVLRETRAIQSRGLGFGAY